MHYFLRITFLLFCSLFISPAFSFDIKLHKLPPNVEANFTTEDVKTFNQKLNLLREIVSLSGKQHIDNIEVTEILDGAFKGMVSSLDKFSYYFTTEEYQSFINEMEQKKGVIGIYLGKSEATKSHTVAKVVELSPAEGAGMKADDIILSVNGYDITSETPQEELSRRLRGRPGTKVIVKVMRPSTRKTIEIEIHRGLLRNLASVRTYLVEDDILVINIDSFRRDTSKEFLDIAKKIESNTSIKLAGIVIDLRNNPGGYTNESIRIADKLLDGGIIAKTKTRESEKVYLAEPGTIFQKLPIIVLANGGTASASEILIAALKDNRRAIVVGTRTYGKGQGQSIIHFKDGSGAIKLTDLRTYTPLGKIYHEIGLEPHITVENFSIDYKESQPDKNSKECKFTPDGLVDAVFKTTSCVNDLQSLTAYNIIRTYGLFKQMLQENLDRQALPLAKEEQVDNPQNSSHKQDFVVDFLVL